MSTATLTHKHEKVWLSIVIAWSALGITSAATNKNGHSKCPCLTNSTLTPFFGTVGADSNCLVFRWKGVDYCYPKNYGFGDCQASWLPPFCANSNGVPRKSAPGACSQKFCYIDPKKCDKNYVDDLSTSVFWNTSKLTLSYMTCGTNAPTGSWGSWHESTRMNASAVQRAIEGRVGELRDFATGAYAALGLFPHNCTEGCPHAYLAFLSSTWFTYPYLILGKTCYAAPTSCTCPTCLANAAWTLKAPKIGFEAKIDLRIATLGLDHDVRARLPSASDIMCVSIPLGSKMVAIKNLDYSDPSRIANMYFGDADKGGLVQWPGQQWCPGRYDSRLRPWYTSAVTGPKDLLILVDRSQSMADSGFWAAAQKAVKTILTSLGERDYANVITFSSDATIYKSEATLLHASTANIKHMTEFINDGEAFGGSNLRAALELAANVIKQNATRTSGCDRIVMLLTDGADQASGNFTNFTIDQFNKMGLGDVLMLTYTFGPHAPDKNTIIHKLAHETGGVHRCIGSVEPTQVVRGITSYYDMFVASALSQDVRWATEFEDATSGAVLLPACAAVVQGYGSNETLPKLRGVACMDSSVLQEVSALKGKPDYTVAHSAMRASAAKCIRLRVNGWRLRELRREASMSCVAIGEDEVDVWGIVVAVVIGLFCLLLCMLCCCCVVGGLRSCGLPDCRCCCVVGGLRSCGLPDCPCPTVCLGDRSCLCGCLQGFRIFPV